MKPNKHIGSSLDNFLEESHLGKDVEEMAVCKLLALRLLLAMERLQVNQAELARRMKTSRATVNRILDPNNTSMTFRTAARASAALGYKLSVKLVEA